MAASATAEATCEQPREPTFAPTHKATLKATRDDELNSQPGAACSWDGLRIRREAVRAALSSPGRDYKIAEKLGRSTLEGVEFR
jgi:hypothetical protein